METGRGFGLAAFTVLLVVLLAFSAAITQPYVTDTDPSTYVIIPILMLPIFALFMFKQSDKLLPKVDTQSMVLGIVLFIALIFLALSLRGYLGPLFFSYRMDMLILPIGIVALASLIFGISNLGKFAWISVYALLASPLLLLQIVSQNLSFASLNSVAIYRIVELLMPAATFSAPITIYFNSQAISIGNACVGVGAMIGLMLFLLPVAYFLEGRPARRAMWVLSGLLLMLLFNFVRMLSIAVAWFAYGPNIGTLDVHAVIGQLLFYATVAIMLLVPGRYGLRYPKLSLGKQRRGYGIGGIAVASGFTLLYLLVSASYLNASSVPITALSWTPAFGPGLASALYGSYISYQGNSYSIMGRGNTSVAIYLANSSMETGQTLVIFGLQNSSAERLLDGGQVTGWKEYLNGANVSYVYGIGGNGTEFIYRQVVPYTDSYNAYLLDMYATQLNYGRYAHPGCQTLYETVYGFLANIAALNPNSINGILDGDYCSVKSVIR